jgi:hypothetical protein
LINNINCFLSFWVLRSIEWKLHIAISMIYLKKNQDNMCTSGPVFNYRMQNLVASLKQMYAYQWNVEISKHRGRWMRFWGPVKLVYTLHFFYWSVCAKLGRWVIMYWCVQHILCCIFVVFVFVLCTLCCQFL